MTGPQYRASLPAGHPDRALVILCNKLVKNWRRANRKRSGEGAADWHAMNDELVGMPAFTPDGMRAKCEVLACVVALEEPLVASLVSDILGRAVGDMPPRVMISPDAALIAASAHFQVLEAAFRATLGDEFDDGVYPDGYDAAFAAVADIPAMTVEGLRAKARALLALYGEPDESLTRDDPHSRIKWSLITGLGQGGVP